MKDNFYATLSPHVGMPYKHVTFLMGHFLHLSRLNDDVLQQLAVKYHWVLARSTVVSRGGASLLEAGRASLLIIIVVSFCNNNPCVPQVKAPPCLGGQLTMVVNSQFQNVCRKETT